MNMRIILFTLFISGCLILNGSCNESNDKMRKNTTISKNENSDSLTKNEFFAIAKEMKQAMDRHTTMTINEIITMVRIYNTLYLANIANDRENADFILNYRNQFEKSYLKEICKQLECSFGKGMTIYSKKYDLYVGIGSEFRSKDFFTIIN